MNDVHEIAQPAETLAVEFPAEPSIGSVVLDPKGYAWQSRADPNGVTAQWCRVQAVLSLIGPGVHVRSWRYLLTDHGTLTLVYRAP